MHEEDLAKGGQPLHELAAQCPADLYAPIFETGVSPIPWLRSRPMQVPPDDLLIANEFLLMIS